MPEVELLGADEALARHETRWRELAVQRGNAFVSPEWFRSWHEYYGAEAMVRVAAVRDESGGLLGLVPLAVEEGRGAGARIAGAILADYVHPVAKRDDEAVVAEAALGALTAGEPAWSALVLDNVDAGAAWTQVAIRDRRGRELRRRRRSETVLPYAELPATYDDYLASRSSNFRGQVRRLDRKLQREAAIELRQTRDEADLPADLATFFRLHFSRWEGRGGSSLAAGSAQAFHESFAPAALRAGWLRLFVLEADGEPIAAFYGWRLGDRYAFFQAGFDEAWSKFSVGLILHGRVIAAAIAEGAREYDMLLGSEPYKFRFCDSVRSVETLVLTRRWHAAGGMVAADLTARRLAARLPGGLKARVRHLESRLPTGRRR